MYGRLYGYRRMNTIALRHGGCILTDTIRRWLPGEIGAGAIECLENMEEKRMGLVKGGVRHG